MTAIGVTGHRFQAEVDRLTAGVDAALQRIRAAFPTEEALTVISPLTEGADQLVVWRALALDGLRLVVPLPLAIEDYLADFATSASRGEFRHLLARAETTVVIPTAPTREAGYEAAGRYVLDYCDVLIALWNGLDEQGPGGTGGLVNEARRRDLPLAWVHTGNRAPDTGEAMSLGVEQGYMSFERFPDQLWQRL